MITLNLHDTNIFSLGEIEVHQRRDDSYFYTRRVVIKNKKGETVEITLFSDEEKTLLTI